MFHDPNTTPRLPDWRTTPHERKFEIVKRMAEESMSSSQIASAFSNITRNSVIGFCHRYKIRLRATTSTRFGPKKPKPQPRPKSIPNFPRAPLPKVDAPPITGGIRFADVTNETCRWPLWDEFPANDEQAKCCGEQTAEGSSWCKHHRQRATGKEVAV